MHRILLLLISFVTLFSLLVVRSYFLFSRKYSVGTKVRVTERLSEEPYHSRSSQIFRLAGFTVLTRSFPAYNYGDMLVVEGELEARAGSSGRGALEKLKQDLWLIYPDISVLSAEESARFPRENVFFKLRRLVTSWRFELVDLFRDLLAEPQASLISGILLGERAQMPERFYTALRETGTLHIIAASGMNVTIIAGILMSFLSRLFTRRVALIFVALGVVFYALLAGASPPVVRAAIMGTVTFAAAFLGRERDGGIALVLTAAVMLLADPRYVFDVGWQLSFTATAGILFGFPILKRYITKWFDVLPLALGDELAVTLSAQLATLPLIVFHFGSLSWISPLVNVLVAPVVPVLMVWGGLVAVVGLVWRGLAQIVAWGAWVFLTYFVWVVEAFGRWFGAVEVGRVSPFWVMGYYLILSWLIWQIKKKTDTT